MKFKAIFAVVIFVFALSGCKSDSDRPILPNLRSISFTADITYYNEHYSADCVIDAEGAFAAMLTSPENLLGLTFEYSGEECRLKYNGLELQNAQKFMPENASISLIRDILSSTKEQSIKKLNKNYKVEGKLDNRAYALYIAPTGLPISLNLPDCGISVEFKNVSLISNEKTGEN